MRFQTNPWANLIVTHVRLHSLQRWIHASEIYTLFNLVSNRSIPHGIISFCNHSDMLHKPDCTVSTIEQKTKKEYNVKVQMSHSIDISSSMQINIMEGCIIHHKSLWITYVYSRNSSKMQIQSMKRNSTFRAGRTYSSSILCFSSQLWCLTTSRCMQ